MSKSKYKVLFMLTLTLSLSSLFFYPITLAIDNVSIKENKLNEITDITTFTNNEDILSEFPVKPGDPTTNTSGSNYLTKAFFTQDSYVDLDENGYVMEWENYQNVKDDSANFDSVNFYLDNNTANPDLRWHPLDTYDQAQSMTLINGDYINSTIFTPEFTYDSSIQGDVFFMSTGETWRSAYSEWTLRVTLERFNPATGDTDFLTQASGEFDDTDEYVGSYYNSTSQAYQGMIYKGTIANETIIPAGYRLRATYEAMLTSSSYNNAQERFELRSGGSGTGSTFYPTQWYINESGNTYDNFYQIENSYESIGIQIYMYEEKYPTIDLDGLINGTRYYDSQDGLITVSQNADFARYKWNSNSYTSFSGSTTVNLPETQGEHVLVVEAFDEYDNKATATYTFSYDPTLYNIQLETPTNNSVITDGQLLNFTLLSSVTFATYEWDKSGTETLFTDPYDIYPNNGFNGLHQLTIHTTDFFGEELYEYYFTFDNDPPEITLNNILNETTQPQGKNIDIEITDSSSPLSVQYKWDSDSYATMTSIGGSIYRAYLPSSEGWHYLSVQANDTFGYSTTKLYAFNTSLTLLNVDLLNMINNSYYQGGNTVEISIINYNGTCKYFWGSDPWSDGTVVDGILVLNESNALSSVPGTFTLTIIVGNAFDEQYEFVFVFTVDQEDPTVLQTNPIPDYNGSRFLNTDSLEFTITDNLTSTSDLIIFYSILGLPNVTLNSPYKIYLDGLEDGNYNLTIYVEDIAGNYYFYYITFIIDTTAPTRSVNVVGDVLSTSGTRYIPANCHVIVSANDDDPNFKTFYNWNNTAYIEFNNDFYLPSIEGRARLSILVNDTLGNQRLWSRYLTIDGTSPEINLQFILNNSKINDITPLRFIVTDIADDSLDIITAKWAIEPSSNVKTSDFNVTLLIGHSSQTEATITIYARDLVGNEITNNFHFDLDFDAPNYDLMDLTNESYIRGGSVINFNITDSDAKTFRYSWDSEDFLTVNGPWDIKTLMNVTAPFIDGTHNLTIYIEDDTGGGIYTNSIEITYAFIIDDLEILFADPNDLTTHYFYTMNYGEIFNFSLNIRDAYNKTALPTLEMEFIRENPEYNLSISTSQFNTTYYTFTINATNITYGEYSEIEFKFYQFSGNSESVYIHLLINRDNGNIIFYEIFDEVIYEQNVTLKLQLRDANNITGQQITYISINDQTTGFTYVLIDEINTIYNLTFYSDEFDTTKGENLLEIYIESNFYYDIRNGSNSISIELLPVPLKLTLDVNSLEIAYDTNLVVTASLTRIDDTPIQFAPVTFYFYIYYKDGSSSSIHHYSINAADYDDLITNSTETNSNGEASMTFTMNKEIEYIIVAVDYTGNEIYDPIDFEYTENILAVSAGLSLQIILIIIGSAVLFTIITALVIYRLVRAKPFEELLEKVSEEDIVENMVKMSPGVILSIFDQMKGPIPLIGNHSLEEIAYRPRMRIGVENFLLKICDQAYSSLGFEEHDDRRRIGSINLPNEDMIGFIHGIQLPNKAMRGGFENLSLIVLADTEFGGLLLANQEFMFEEIDLLIEALKSKKPLVEVEILMDQIRRKSVQIMIAAKKNAKDDKKNLEQYK